MNTKIFLASAVNIKKTIVPHFEPHYILESFIYLRSRTKKIKDYLNWCLSAKEFLLDSGAFAFINKSKQTIGFSEEELQKYIDDYIEFINQYDIKLFFEMDIDCVVGYDKVKEIRQYIEEKTNKRVIPVWHRNRGMEDFHSMCKEYEYVAIGGIAAKEIKRSEFGLLCELCDIAHSYGCKIHGLGYSPLSVLNERKCPFDTIDSTTWIRHMNKASFSLDDGVLKRVNNDDRYWRTLDQDSYSAWVEFSKLPDVYQENC